MAILWQHAAPVAGWLVGLSIGLLALGAVAFVLLLGVGLLLAPQGTDERPRQATARRPAPRRLGWWARLRARRAAASARRTAKPEGTA